MKLAQENSRIMNKEDIMFAQASKAKQMIDKIGEDKVINATLGALLDDDGSLVVLENVNQEMKSLSVNDYFEYAPINGIPAYLDAVKKEVLKNHHTERFIEVVSTPGGTGAIANTIANYSRRGDKVLTSDWYWAPYNHLCQEQERKFETFEMFDQDFNFNLEDLARKVDSILQEQGRLLLILNTPAHNPTGYTLSSDEWDKIISILNNEKYKDMQLALLVDIAYVDYAGESSVSRLFLDKVEKLNENILPIIVYSASKSFSAYGTRTGACLCLAPTEELADEFVHVTSYTARNTWSNCNRAGQTVIANIVSNEEIMKKFNEERSKYMDILLERGKAFEKEADLLGLKVLPYHGGFFACVECENSTELTDKLAEKGAFVIPLPKGIRIAIASISKEKAVRLAKMIAEEI